MQKTNSYTYNDIYVGMGFSISRKITEKSISDFSNLTGDNHPFHTDDKFAKENLLDGIIAHGMLISSFSSALVGMLLPGKNMILLSQSFDYIKPVYPGSTITVEGKVKRKIDPLKVIFVDVLIKSDRGEAMAKGEIKIKLLK